MYKFFALVNRCVDSTRLCVDKFILGCAVVFLALANVPAHAEEEEKKKWKGEGELSYVETSGNTETENLIAGFKLSYEGMKFSHYLDLSASHSSSAGTTTAERYVAAVKSTYSISERGYIFGRDEYENDRFAGYDYRIKETVGYGHWLVKRERVELRAEAGPGGRHSRTTLGDKEDELILYAWAGFSWKVSKSATMEQELKAEVGEEGTQSDSVTSLKAAVAKNLALKTSYTIRNNTDPPPGARSTDTQFAVTLLFNF